MSAVSLTWPAGLPPFQAANYARRPAPLAARFEPEAGPTIQRRRFRAGPEQLRLELRLTAAQLDVFWAFWRGDAAGGASPFRLLDPVRGDEAIFQFHATEPPEESLDPPWHVVSFVVERRP